MAINHASVLAGDFPCFKICARRISARINPRDGKKCMISVGSFILFNFQRPAQHRLSVISDRRQFHVWGLPASDSFTFSYAGIRISFSTIIYSSKSIKICEKETIRDQMLNIENRGLDTEDNPPSMKPPAAPYTGSSKKRIRFRLTAWADRSAAF
jgi:hypothetical protein